MNRQTLLRGLAGSLLPALLLALPLFSACKGGAPTDEPGEGTGAAAPSESGGGAAEPDAPVAPDPSAAGAAGDAMADPAAAASKPGAPEAAPEAAAFQPDPDGRFAPGGEISDADLARYHVEMTGAIDGEEVGTMTFAMWTEGAPITTRNFLRLVDEGFYDGLSFHRILRDFMIQGGDPTGTGGGNSPYGTIQAEFSGAPEREHHYGVLSMARLGHDENSASCQFFLCCAETPSVWNLDNKYTSFGRLTSGVETLEALANVPTALGPGGREKSKPLAKATIASARVVEGEAPRGEVIARPEEPLDLGGEPQKIVVQHVLISFEGRRVTGVTRTQDEAKKLADEILERARGGESMDALVREYSDDPVAEDDDTPGHYGILNNGVRDRAGDRKMFELQRDFQAAAEELQTQQKEGKITQQEFQTQIQELQTAAQKKASDGRFMPRTGLVPAFGDVGFGLAVGEIGLASFDPTKSPFGYHIIKRVE